jgi:hypothetical protein
MGQISLFQFETFRIFIYMNYQFFESIHQNSRDFFLKFFSSNVLINSSWILQEEARANYWTNNW